MTTLTARDQEAFLSRLGKQFSQAPKEKPLEQAGKKAWDYFLGLGLPSRRLEAYRYIKLSRLYSRSFQLEGGIDIGKEKIAPFVLPECQGSVLVFVNGRYQPRLSNTGSLPDRVVAVPLAEAMHTYGTYLSNQWAKAMKEEMDPFAVLNAALNRDGAFLYLPPKTLLDIPVQTLFLADPQDTPMLMSPRVHTFVGAQSQIELVSTHATLSGENFFANSRVEWVIEEGARVKNIQIKHGSPGEAWIFDATRATLKRDSSFHTVSLTDGGATVRNDYRILLAGENAEALLNGFWRLRDKKEAHTHVFMDHQAPNCRSRQLFKGVLDDYSRSSFEGKIYVRPKAQKTEAYQYNHNLLLSDKANADCMPNLEIFADDVKASHGATVGQLDKEQLFFLKARGFREKEAKNLLIQGFCREMIDLIKIPSLRERMEVTYDHTIP